MLAGGIDDDLGDVGIIGSFCPCVPGLGCSQLERMLGNAASWGGAVLLVVVLSLQAILSTVVSHFFRVSILHRDYCSFESSVWRLRCLLF